MNYEYFFSIECRKCKETLPPLSQKEIGEELKCPYCGTPHILQCEDIERIEFPVTLEGKQNSLVVEVIPERRQLKPKGFGFAFVSEGDFRTPSIRSVNRKYEEIKRELENNPDWEGYSWGEYLTDEDTPISE
jgi:DNA-directed RNA polymerase subunit RPC12/RpoP